MIKNYDPAHYETVAEYFLEFDHMYGGYSFPCDENGKLLPMSKEAVANYEWCIQNSALFDRFNQLQRRTRRVRKNATGTCSCGTNIELYDEYEGACECPNCGKWYNLFGQELVAPRYWEE